MGKAEEGITRAKGRITQTENNNKSKITDDGQESQKSSFGLIVIM